MLANLSVPLVGIADTAVMGRLPSPDYLAAVAVASTLFSSLYWAFGFLRMGTGGMIAQAYGAGDETSIARITARHVLLAGLLGVSIVLTGPFWIWLGMLPLQVSDTLDGLVRDYFGIRLFSAPATLMLYVLFGTLIGLQRMRSLLLLQLLLNLSNIALNLLFFHWFDWHVQGVALATLISEYLTVAVGFWLLRSLPASLMQATAMQATAAPGARHWLFETAALKRLGNISLDLFIRTCCLTFAFYWITVCGSRLGAAVLAANAILLHLLHLSAHLLDGFAHAAETLVGQAIGQRSRTHLRTAISTSLWLALAVAALLSVIIVLGGPVFIHTMSTDPEVRQLARQWLFWMYPGPIIGVWSFMLDGIFIGATETRSMRDGMLISLAVFLLSSLLLMRYFGNDGLWLAYHLLMVARAATLAMWYRKVPATIRRGSASAAMHQ